VEASRSIWRVDMLLFVELLMGLGADLVVKYMCLCVFSEVRIYKM
jgi:hypothetical protein